MPAVHTLEYGSRGDAVVALQRLLDDNPWHQPARRLAQDGVFGPLTAAACQQAKYWLGYPAGEVRPFAGPLLLDYLRGARKPGRQALARIAARKKKAAAERAAAPLRLRALEFARADLGLHEAANNLIKYNHWWLDSEARNDGAPYCVRAGSYWYAKAGSTVVKAGVRYEGCSTLLEDAKAGRNGVHLTSDPAPGDGFVIDFDGKAVPDHFGLYVADAGGPLFKSLEANAQIPGGEGVGYHEREYRHCWFVVFER